MVRLVRALALLLASLLLAGCTAPSAETETPSVPSAVGGATGGAGAGAGGNAGGSGTGTGGGGVTPGGTGAPVATPGGLSTLPRFGVAYSPADAAAPSAFFVQAADVGGLVMWGGDVRTLGDSQGAADVIATLARQQGLAFGAQVGFHRPGQPFDDAAKATATANVVGFAERAKPSFLVLGVELDRIAASDPAWIDAFAAWYADAYDAVKAASPGTLVFPSFQLEHTKGLTGGLFGGPDLSATRWDVIERFPERDMTAFTTYPSLLYQGPGGIPDDYYTGLRDRFSGPIGFTEVGWHATDKIEGWASNEAEQAAFVERFLADAQELDATMALWLHLHDQPTVQPEPFQSMGLVGPDGVKRASYDAWVRGVTTQ